MKEVIGPRILRRSEYRPNEVDGLRMEIRSLLDTAGHAERSNRPGADEFAESLRLRASYLPRYLPPTVEVR